jgi:hypothetical protein
MSTVNQESISLDYSFNNVQAKYKAFDGLFELFRTSSDYGYRIRRAPLSWDVISEDPNSKIKRLKVPKTDVTRSFANEAIRVDAKSLMMFGRIAYEGSIGLQTKSLQGRDMLGLCAFLAKSVPMAPLPSIHFRYRGALPQGQYKLDYSEGTWPTKLKQIKDPFHYVGTNMDLDYDESDPQDIKDKRAVLFSGKIGLATTARVCEFLGHTFRQSELVSNMLGEEERTKIYGLYGTESFEELRTEWCLASNQASALEAANYLRQPQSAQPKV